MAGRADGGHHVVQPSCCFALVDFRRFVGAGVPQHHQRVVSDPAGAAVPNVTVIATETRTGTKAQTVSDSAGAYTIPFLLPGTYQISAESKGFKRYVRNAVEIASGDHPVMDIRLEVGEVSQSIDVTESVSMVNSENASVGQSIAAAQVEDLPLNGRALR